MALSQVDLRRLLAETLTATAASVIALAVAARVEGRAPLQPLNATSHWLNGPGSADEAGLGWRTTGVGLATHLAATGFWAALYEAWLGRGRRSSTLVLSKAAAMAGVSALVDYRATPKRFTPGWEFVLSPAAMAAVYLALGAGLALGALAGSSSGPREDTGRGVPKES
jgi:hypothetical protein